MRFDGIFSKSSTSAIICPYCNYHHNDWHEWFRGNDEQTIEADCENEDCERTFEITLQIEYTMHTDRLSCPNDAHTFGGSIARHVNQKDCDAWNKENFCNRNDHTPYTTWLRECKLCGDEERKKVELAGPCPKEWCDV